MKTKTITLLTSAACLASLITLTSCGNSLKDVDFASYKNEISEEKFYEKVDSLDTNDLKGYTISSYMGTNTETSGNTTSSYLSINEETEKFDFENNKSYYKSSYIYEKKSDSVSETEEGNTEVQYQKNGEDIVKVNLIAKLYYKASYFPTPYLDLADYIYDSEAVRYEKYESFDAKYYLDDDVYTAVYSKSESNENSSEGVTVSYSNDVKAVVQFYLKDNKFVFKSQIDENNQAKTIKDGNTVEKNITSKIVETYEIDLTVPSIDNIDLSKYDENLSMNVYIPLQ